MRSETATLDNVGETEQRIAPQDSTTENPAISPMIHRFAVALTISVFPLIWVGGLVTTYDAGMAVPDWPGTYGWNMFAYPPSTWLFGPFDLLVEHSHRLLGALAGLLAIGLVVTAFLYESRGWFRFWTVLILLAVIAQGLLGGVRVLLDQRTFAMVHGCTASLFFALATGTAVMSSRWWRNLQSESRNTHLVPSRLFACVTTATLIMSYCQLIMGAQLRHVTGGTSPKVFTGFVHMHLALAAIVLLLASWLLGTVLFRHKSLARQVKRPTWILFGIVFLQITLGFATWIVNYALPWQSTNATLATYTIAAKGFWESIIVTSHVATGALIISLSAMLALRTWRLRWLGADQDYVGGT